MSRIVIAEDDPFIIRVIALWLRKQGHDVQEGRHGAAALELMKAAPTDVLITDVNMPVMDGLQLLEQTIGAPFAPRGVIVMTNRWDHREIGERIASLSVHVVTKPFSPSKLAALVDQLTAASAATPAETV